MLIVLVSILGTANWKVWFGYAAFKHSMKKKFKLFCHFCNTIPIIVVFCLKRIIFRFKEVLSSKPKICLLIDINISILHGQTLFEHFIKIGSKEIRLLLYCTTLVCGQIINQIYLFFYDPNSSTSFMVPSVFVSCQLICTVIAGFISSLDGLSKTTANWLVTSWNPPTSSLVIILQGFSPPPLAKNQQLGRKWMENPQN